MSAIVSKYVACIFSVEVFCQVRETCSFPKENSNSASEKSVETNASCKVTT